jgi:hypothetical protein
MMMSVPVVSRVCRGAALALDLAIPKSVETRGVWLLEACLRQRWTTETPRGTHLSFPSFTCAPFSPLSFSSSPFPFPQY